MRVAEARFEENIRTHLINRSGARGERFGVAARREDGEYPQRSSTDEQRRRRAKEPPPSGLAWEMPSGVVAPRSQPQVGDAPSSRLARGHFPGQRAPLLFMRWVLEKRMPVRKINGVFDKKKLAR